jgi:serine/threonine-protein kinase HipA
MLMAEAAGLSVVPHGLISVTGGYAYITRRIDRIVTSDSPEVLLAMEDFCQLSLRLTQDKYKGSYEQCAKVIRTYSIRPRLDLSELFLRLVFCFLTGNSDMHLKNFSLIETQAGSGEYILSPAYDLLPVNIIIPEDPEELALQLNGKKSNLRRKNFLAFAENAGIARNAAEAMLRDQLKKLPKWEKMCEESLLPNKMKQELSDLMSWRAARLE